MPPAALASWRTLRARNADRALDELAVEYDKARQDAAFQAELDDC